MRFRAILNRDGGMLRTMDLNSFAADATQVFAEQGHQLECRLVDGRSVKDQLDRAAQDDAIDAVVVGGGDGTVSAAAASAFKSGKPLGILPAGTMNLFARAIHMPSDLPSALQVIARGDIRKIDIATANGQPFVHQFGVGVHARLVRIRENMVFRSRTGKMLASLRAIAAAAMDPPRFEVELRGQIGRFQNTVCGIAISNNPLNNDPVPVAAQLDTGLLGVYMAESVTTNELISLVVDVVTGRWRDNDRISEYEVPQLTLRFPHRKRNMYAVIDGELIALESVVQFEMHRGGLSIIGGPV